jgi:hypothetical protein
VQLATNHGQKITLYNQIYSIKINLVLGKVESAA